MKRLGIFVFYDKEGIADDYVYYLLDSMFNITDKIIIAINGTVYSDCLNRFYDYTDDIVRRENKGYDAGAYKEIILNLEQKNELQNWDELVLFNDTFYGPFFSWQVIFEEMERKNVDFWGLSKWIGGKVDWYDDELPEHIQSYFLVIRKKMMASDSFLEFWREMGSLSTYYDTIYRFEVMFTVYHAKEGFKYASWLDNHGEYLKQREVIYLKYPQDLIKTCRFPILKRRAVTISNFVQVGETMHYIEKKYKYDTKMIWDNIKRKEKTESLAPFTFCDIEHFVQSHKKIYIYGYGKWGHSIESLFLYKGWEIAGIIDSDASKHNQFVRRLQDVQLEAGDGMIVALGEKWVQEAYLQLKELFEEKQLMLPNIRWCLKR